MTASTRRAALGAILAAPLTGGAVMALPSGSASLPDDEARFLVIGPQLVKLLDEYDRLWEPSHAAYEAWQAAGRHLPIPRWPAMEALPEWKVYCDVRQPADDLNEVLKALYEPFEDLHLTSLPAVLLRCRYAATFETYQEEALADIARLWREGTLCA